MISSWSRYPWDNDTDWEFIWIADSRYIDSAGAVSQWVPYKSPPGLGLVWTASGAARPIWNADYGTRNAGSLYFDGISSIMFCNALAAYVTGFQECSHFMAFQLVTLDQFKTLLAFANGSAVRNFFIFQTRGSSTGSFDKPFGGVQLDSTGTVFGQSYVGANGDTARNYWSQTYFRAPPSNPTPNLYSTNCQLFNNNPAQAVNSPLINYTNHSMVLTTASFGGFPGAATFTNMRLRAFGFTRRNIRANLGAQPTDSQKAAGKYLVNEAL